MMVSRLHVEEAADRVVVTLDNPDRGNAIDLEMVAGLHDACAALEQRPRPLILTGAGRMFAAGADIAQLRERTREDALQGINSRLFDRIARLPMPTVALLHGHVLGGGAELAYACDFRIGAPDVQVGNPEVGLGIVAAAGAAWRLADLVGESLAKQVLLAGAVLDADRALSAGLLSEVVEPDGLLAAGHRLVDRIGRQSALAVRLTKLAMSAPRGSHPLVDELAQAILFEDDEKVRRMTAFLERKGA